MDQGICGFPSSLSHEAFPRGFPTGLLHVPPLWLSILGEKVEAVQGKQVPLKWTETSGGLGMMARPWSSSCLSCGEWTETSGGLGMVARPWSSSYLSCGDGLLLRCNGNDGNSFPTKQGKDPSSRAMRQKRGSPGCAMETRASSRVETGMSGTFLSCGKCVKDLLEFPEIRCD